MTSDLFETTKTSSFTSEELQCRIEKFKQSLIAWRKILLPLNNLLEWEHKYDPLIIFGVLTTIFLLIHQTNPSVLTLISSLVLICVLSDVLIPIAMSSVHKNEEWTSMNDMKYARLCERLARLEQQIKYQYQSALKIRQERPTMYLMLRGIVLAFLAICGQRFDNLLLTYLSTLILCLLPGVYHHQLFQIIAQHLRYFWNNHQASISFSAATSKPKVQ